MDAFVDNLKFFAKSFGADGIQELNAACPKHQMIMAPQENTKFRYGGLVVDDGLLRLVFAENTLGSNVGDVSKDFATALKNASTAPEDSRPFNIVARNAVQKDYEPKIGEVRAAIAKLVNMPDLKLMPNFEANATELAKSADQGWDKQIGAFTLQYFEALKKGLERQKFDGDDMQQEAFQEAVEKGQVCFRILPKWEDGKSRYNEVKVDDGILYIQVRRTCYSLPIFAAFASHC